MSTDASTLWMGDLEPYMDEYFITTAFQSMGQTAKSIKLIKNKMSGLPAGYCFITFADPETAHNCMLKLNGKTIPHSSPPKRFKLNSASHGKEGGNPTPEFSLFVGDLTDDVDDYILYYAFSKRYRSCRSAKVVLEGNGRSKGYGFVRFSEETDQQRALIEMQHMTGLGRRPIRVSLATPKRPLPPEMSGSGIHYSHYYGHNYPYSNTYYNYYNSHSYYNQYYSNDSSGYYDYHQEDDSDVLEEPELEVDVDRYNRDFMEQSEEIFEVLENSRWTPLDSIMAKIEEIP